MTSKIVVNNIGSDTGINTVTFDSNVERGTSNLHSVGVEVAGINVLGADTPIGTGSTIYDDGGARFSGIVTATSFSGSFDASNLTGTVADARISTLTASKLSGTLPAISGANLTNLPASGKILQVLHFRKGDHANATIVGSTKSKLDKSLVWKKILEDVKIIEKLIVRKGEEISEEMLASLHKLKLTTIIVRSKEVGEIIFLNKKYKKQ